MVFGLGALTAACLTLQPGALGVEPAPVLPIVGGDEAGSCEFPFTVAILEDDETPTKCSGTLVNPNVVTLAAHCVDPQRPIVAVGFGEEGQGETGPQRVVPVVDCVGHPQYFQMGFPDIAYCTLADPVQDVAIMPILAGCELDLLEVGSEVTIVGFGASYGTVVSGEVEAEGVGPKRFTTQTIEEVSPGVDEVYMVGPNGSQSACFGDSGGPALLELPDGTWRVFGAASRLYDPGGFPPPAQPDNICGVGVIYGLLTTQIEWLEAETGYDLTPCHDGTGDWDPGSGCGDFPMDPELGAGTWKNGCVGGAVGGGEPVCEPDVGTTGGGGESGTGPTGDGSTTGGASEGSTTGIGGGTAGSTGDGPKGTDTGKGEGSSGGKTPMPPPKPGTGDSSSGDAGQDDQDAAGCGCTQGGGPAGALWLGLGLLGFRRRS